MKSAAVTPLALWLGLAVALSGQPPQGAPALAFEVASVKMVATDRPAALLNPDAPPPPPAPYFLRPTPTGLTIENATLKYCLAWAYNVREWQIAGPGWIERNRYEIAAKAAGPVDTAQLRAMLQTLLTDRFRLTLRRETKEARVLALVVGPGGIKLTPSKPGSREFRRPAPGPEGGLHWEAGNSTTDALVPLLSMPFWDPVVDRTGLTERFDFTFDLPRPDSEHPSEWLGLIQAALERQLGLRLEPRKEPVETIAIERGSPAPDEN